MRESSDQRRGLEKFWVCPLALWMTHQRQLSSSWKSNAQKENLPQQDYCYYLTPLDFFADFTFAGVKTHKIGCAAKRIGPAVHLLVSTAEVLCSNSVHQPKGQHVPGGWCARQGSNPVLGSTPAAWFWLLFLWL